MKFDRVEIRQQANGTCIIDYWFHEPYPAKLSAKLSTPQTQYLKTLTGENYNQYIADQFEIQCSTHIKNYIPSKYKDSTPNAPITRQTAVKQRLQKKLADKQKQLK